MSCPRDAGHGSGPWVGPARLCYFCAKRAVESGASLPAEVRLYAGFPPARPAEDGWTSLGRLATFELAPLDRVRRYEASEGFRALVEAIRKIGEAG